MDPRIKKLAENLVNYSCKVKNAEKVLIECTGSSAIPLVKALIKETYRAGGVPFVNFKDPQCVRELLKDCTISQLSSMADYELVRMREMNAYIGIGASDNVSELSDIVTEKMNMYMKYYNEVINEVRINNTKWVVLRYPNYSMAQLANTSTEAFRGNTSRYTDKHSI